MKAIVHEFKYGGLKNLAYDLARTCARHVPSSFFEGIDIVVPVPLHFLRSIQRGYNQADCIARGIISGSGCGATLAAGAVCRIKMTKTQTVLSRDQRVKNVHGAFSVKAGKITLVKDKGVILVDDIITTGATTGQCAAALLDAGAKRVRVLSLARD
jgi:ComF family protein